MKTLAAIAAFSAVMATGTAMADSGSYTGNWQVTLTRDLYLTTKGYTGHRPKSTHCVVLTDGLNFGRRHSGSAVLDGQYEGDFQVINGNVVIFVDVQGSGEEPASATFTARARDGDIDENGAYDIIQGGTSYELANATFGAKGSC
ncbi:MAG TPA: hypothetical protein VKR31_06065 [Rhizomicrobium sp.]|nr:hypothetical protein [Rhizomicrobium sp.]